MTYFPDRPPPSATGPGDLGAYCAAIEAVPGPAGWGASEQEALAALGASLGEKADGEPPKGSLTAFGQALTAASLLPTDDLIARLRSWSGETVLAPEAATRWDIG